MKLETQAQWLYRKLRTNAIVNACCRAGDAGGFDPLFLIAQELEKQNTALLKELERLHRDQVLPVIVRDGADLGPIQSGELRFYVPPGAPVYYQSAGAPAAVCENGKHVIGADTSGPGASLPVRRSEAPMNTTARPPLTLPDLKDGVPMASGYVRLTTGKVAHISEIMPVITAFLHALDGHVIAATTSDEANAAARRLLRPEPT